MLGKKAIKLSHVCIQQFLCRLLLAKGGRHWFYTYLYGKQDTANISEAELVGFRELAKYYAVLTTEQIRVLMRRKELVEICHDCKK